MPARLSKTCLLCAAASSALLLASSNTYAASETQLAQDDTGSEEIIITARRRAESAQKTPVSVTALSSEGLREAGIKNLVDLTASVPGVNFTNSGSDENAVYSIRGLSRGVVGIAPPAVVTYVNDVPQGNWVSSPPTFDVQSIQVLKGPQGTLFGKNTTAGAILVSTKQPTYDFGGTLEGTFGDYNWRQVEGAANIPIVKDKVALRLAGQWARRDGYTKNDTFAGQDFDDIHRNAGRISLLLEPVEGFKNVTVYDFRETHTFGAGMPFYRYTPGQTVDLLGPIIGVDFAAIAAREEALGLRHSGQALVPAQSTRVSATTNTTTVELGSVTLKNIFSYRTTFYSANSNTDGIFEPVIDSQTNVNLQQLTNEFQVSGQALKDKLTYIVGLYYEEAKPNGDNRLTIQQFAFPGTSFTSTDTTDVFGLAPFLGGVGASDYYTDVSKAVFGQISYDFGGITPVLDGLKVDAGYRYTQDRESVCSIPFSFAAAPIVHPEDCPADVTSTQASTKSNAGTYTLGLSYQITSDVMVYAVTRRGYRAGGINTPVFGGSLVPFQSFKPEFVNDVEIGFKSNWRYRGWSGLFNVAAYQANYAGLQTNILTGANQDPDGDGIRANNPANTTFYANVGKAKVRGLEIEAVVSPFDGLDLSAGASWIDKQITDLTFVAPASLGSVLGTVEGVEANAFLGAPKYGYNAGVKYRLPVADTVGEVVFNAKFYMTSSMAFAGVVAKPWSKLDFRIDWNRVYGSPIDVGLFVTNATDKAGVIAGSLTSNGLGISSVLYNEPRMFGGQIRYHFGAE